MSRTRFERRTALLAVLAAVFLCIGLAAALLPEQWIEKLFEAEPDGGDGSFELLLALIPVGIGLLLGTIAAFRWRAPGHAARTTDVAPGTTGEQN